MKKHFPVFLIFLLFALGCASTGTIESTKVSPSEIYQEFSISADSSQTEISVIFRVGGAMGTTVDLDAPSKIEHNGKEMSEQAPSFLKGTTYFSHDAGFQPTHQFVFTDAKGKIYQNEIRMEPIEIVGNEFDLSRSQTNKIALSRRLETNENVLLSLASEKQPPHQSNANANGNVNNPNADVYSIVRAVNADETRSAIIVEPFQLKKFVTGRAVLSIEVRKEETLKQATDKGGKMVFTYESAEKSVNILN